MRFTKLLSIVLACALFCGVFAPTHEAEAQYSTKYRNADRFIAGYCAQMRIDFAGHKALLDAIANLMNELKNINGNLVDFGFSINPPANCIPNFDFGASFNMPDLSSCMAAVSFTVPDISSLMPDVGGLAQCVLNLAPNINVDLPNLDLSGCMMSVGFDLNLGDITAMISGLIRAIAQILSSLKNIVPAFQLSINPNFLATANLLARICTQNRIPRRNR